MKLSLHSDQIASLLYRSTIHLRLPVLVAVWTIVVATLSVLVTALLLALLRGGANWAILVLAASVAILITPPIAYKISQLMRELERSRTALQSLVRIDSLTGLANRRHFFQQAEQLLESALPPALPVSALMIDVDHFKSINDEAGHADRKSTRLNSSHPSISYAVFCLKKKKQKQINNFQLEKKKQMS